MHLKETSFVPASALPLGPFREHLRLASGFADTVTEEPLLEQFLRAAIASVEARTGRALFARGFELRVSAWRREFAQRLPLAPVVAITAVTLVDCAGAPRLVAPDQYYLDDDAMRPHLRARGVILPGIPTGGRAEVAFEAGFGPVWPDIPADLRQAVLLLAAQYYERRDAGGDMDMTFGVRALLERWRDVRMGVGG